MLEEQEDQTNYIDNLIVSKQIELGIPITKEGEPEYYDDQGNAKLKFGRSLLHQAVDQEDVESVKEILASEIDLTIKDNGGKTAYQRALEKRNKEIIDLFKSKIMKQHITEVFVR